MRMDYTITYTIGGWLFIYDERTDKLLVFQQDGNHGWRIAKPMEEGRNG